jgi:hypothetical protein
MIRAQLAAAAIVLCSTGALALLDGGCCTRALAQTQAAPSAPSLWEHNGSTLYLVESGTTREFRYQKPRPGMAEVGARPGTLLFRGRLDDGQFSGTAYIFNPRCGPIPFQVKGSALDDGERIVLTGQAPLVGRKCRVFRTFASSLEFTRSQPLEAAHAQEPSAAPPAPDSQATKPEAPSAGELAGAPATQPAGPNGSPLAANDASRRAAARRDAGAPAAAEPSVTNKIPSAATDPESYRSGAILLVAIVSLFSFSLAISLGQTGFRRKR